MATALTSGKSLSDGLRYDSDPRYTRASGFLANNTGAEVTVNVRLMPVKVVGGNYEIVLATDEANATGVIVEDRTYTIADGEVANRKVPVMVNGPAILSLEGLPTADPAGTAYTMATLTAAYAAFDPPIKVVDNSENQQLEPLTA